MVYYLTHNQEIITSYDLEKAFFIVTGKDPETNEKEFWKFRERCFGKSIKCTVNPTVENFCKDGHRIPAVRLYKELHNCSFKEAKEYVDKYCEEHNYYPYNILNRG